MRRPGHLVLRIEACSPTAAGSVRGMATKLHRDPELAAAVARARVQAERSGELRPPRVGTVVPSMPSEAQKIIGDWVRDGGYQDAVTRIGLEDPDLATQ